MLIGIDASRANQREKTGTEWYSWHLIRALIPRLRGHRVRLYVREPLRADWGPLEPPAEVQVLKWPIGIVWSHLRLGWELLRRPPDMLFVPADTVPIVRRCPTVTTIHDIAFERHPELYARRSVQRRLGWARPFIHAAVRILTLGRYSASEVDYHRWSVRHALRVSQTILTVSEFTKQELVELLGAKPEQIVVTYQGVQQPETLLSVTEAERQAVKAQHGLKQAFFLYVGRLERKKNIEALLQGFQEFCRTGAGPHHLVLVGSPGYGWDSVAGLLDSPDLRGRVHQLGWLSEDHLRVLRTAAAAFVFLSAYEGFGVPPLESFSAGVPVIASRNGSIPEILGSAAVYADPADPSTVAAAMARLVHDPALAQRLVRQGQTRVRAFTWEKTADRTAAALLASLPKLA
jgi:glycosyltransferase involved in cell wall biosynthesis